MNAFLMLFFFFEINQLGSISNAVVLADRSEELGKIVECGLTRERGLNGDSLVTVCEGFGRRVGMTLLPSPPARLG